MVELFANSEDPDQMPHSAASDLGLHCLPITLFGFSRVNMAYGRFISLDMVLAFLNFIEYGILLP